MDVGLQKKQLARKLCVDETTIHDWEDKRVAPAIHFMPRIIEFLGYDPTDDGAPQSLGERLRSHRKRLGLSQKKLAARIRTDEATLSRWETDPHRDLRLGS